jgi:hypothetical protein
MVRPGSLGNVHAAAKTNSDIKESFSIISQLVGCRAGRRGRPVPAGIVPWVTRSPRVFKAGFVVSPGALPTMSGVPAVLQQQETCGAAQNIGGLVLLGLFCAASNDSIYGSVCRFILCSFQSSRQQTSLLLASTTAWHHPTLQQQYCYCTTVQYSTVHC